MATAATFETAQKLYIAFYQRPADPEGLKFWADKIEAAEGSLAGAVEAFGTSDEAIALLGTVDSTTIGDVVDDIFMAAFGRMADAVGKAFYVDGFNEGRFTPATIALDIINGATGSDATVLDNKVAAADVFTDVIDGGARNETYGDRPAEFTYIGSADIEAARTFLSSVTDDAATIPTYGDTVETIRLDIADAGDPGLPDVDAFTLTEIRQELPDSTPTQMATYWGDPETGEGVPAGQVWNTISGFLATAGNMRGNLFDINDSLSEIREITVVGVGETADGGDGGDGGDGAVMAVWR